MKRHGLLLAGGRSVRFGREKAVADAGDGLLMDAALAALSAVSDRTAVSARPGSGAAWEAARRGLALVVDRPGSPGPLRGIQAGLVWAAEYEADWLVTAPCDILRIEPEAMDRLVEVTVREHRPALAASSRGVEPLIAVWPVTEALRQLNSALVSDDHPPVRDVLLGLGARLVEGFDGINVNRPEDLPARPGDR